MNKEQNNYAFIDSQNVYLSIKSQGWDIDWARFRIYLTDHYEVSKAFLFLGYIEGNNKLYAKLQEAGFICIWKPVLTYKDGTVKGNVDAELVLHTMIQLPNFNKAVVVTGDGDFYCLIQHLLELNKLQTVLVPDHHKYSALLKKFAKKNIAFMNDLKNKIGTK
ncbi:hypothetical protein BH11PAT3_BH11PAT3_2540 [soil metagenome]